MDVFKEIFGRELKRVKYKGHPPYWVLQQYLRGELKDERRFSEQILEGLITGELKEWTLPEVAAHVMTCKRCSKRIVWLRGWGRFTAAVRLIQAIQRKVYLTLRSIPIFMEKILESPGFSRKRAFYGHLGGWVTIGVAIALLFIYQPFELWTEYSYTSEATYGEVVTIREGTLALKILKDIAIAWGSWGITGLALHGYKAFRKKRHISEGKEEK